MADQQVAVDLFLENLPIKLMGGSMILLGFGRHVLVVLGLMVASKIVCAAIRAIGMALKFFVMNTHSRVIKRS